MTGYTYILLCSDDSYYIGSTKDLELRLMQHQNGEGANHTRKRLPVKFVYYEEYDRIDTAYFREKQIQNWSRKKKQALINGWDEELKKAAECMNKTHWKNYPSTTLRDHPSTTLSDHTSSPPFGSAQGSGSKQTEG